MTTPGRSTKGVFKRSTKGVLAPAGFKEFERLIASTFQIRISYDSIEHVELDLTPIETLTQGSSWIFDEGLLPQLNRLLGESEKGFAASANGLSALWCWLRPMKITGDVLRSDTMGSHPGWTDTTYNFEGELGTLPDPIFKGSTYEQTATGARVSFSHNYVIAWGWGSGKTFNGLVTKASWYTAVPGNTALLHAIQFTDPIAPHGLWKTRLLFSGWLYFDAV